MPALPCLSETSCGHTLVVAAIGTGTGGQQSEMRKSRRELEKLRNKNKSKGRIQGEEQDFVRAQEISGAEWVHGELKGRSWE